MRAVAATAFTAAGLSLAACGDGGVTAPTNAGICWHMARPQGQPPRFNQLSTGVTSIEQCAGNLEAMRMRFRGMGLTQEEMVGAYQGQFLFLRSSGVWVGPSLEARPYLALVRTGDGRLATIGAVRRPPGVPAAPGP